MRKLTLALLTGLLVLPAASAAVFVVPSDQEMIRRSHAIVIATALTSYPQLNGEGGIETVTPISIEEVIKGNVLASTINVVEPGGEFNGRAMIIASAPRFTPGQRMLLFLRATGPSRWSVTELVLGKFAFRPDGSGQMLLVRDAEEIVGWDADLRPHRERARSAERFLEFVRRESRGGFAPANYTVDTQAVTSNATIGPNVAPYSASSYTMTLSGSQGGRWSVFPSAVTWFRGTATEPGAPGGGDTAINGAFAAWNNDCPSNVNYYYAGADNGTHTQGLHGADGANTILFERDLTSYGISPFTCSGSGYSGTVGLGGITSASGSNILNGETFLTTNEADVEMNKGVANCTLLFNNGDWNSSVTHEVGHTLGFRHSDQNRADNASWSGGASLECTSSAIMTSFVPSGLSGALQAWDVHAVQAVYPGGSCGTTARVKGDFNADGRSDIVWRNASAGISTIWFMSGLSVGAGSGLTSLQLPGSYGVGAVGDFNGDGFADIVWRNSATGDNILWLMNGTNVISGGSLPTVPASWSIIGAGDFNADGRSDLVWRNSTTGDSSIWLMSGLSILPGSGTIATIASPWTIAGIGDFNADGKSDLLWRNSATGATSIWFMSGATLLVSDPTNLQISATWQVAAVGDFNGDAYADIVWRNSATGENIMWLMTNQNVSSASGPLLTVADLNWKIEAEGDFNGDGRYDLVWRNDSTGVTTIWFMSGTTILSGSGTLATVPAPYVVAGPGPRY